jgi:hypothetical protein
MGRGPATIAVLAIAMSAIVAAPAAQAGPNEDYTAVKNDWLKDGVITACRFSVAQLQNANRVSAQSTEDPYTSFPDAINNELKRWSAGKCRTAKTAKMRLTVSPHSVKKGKLTTFTFTVTVPDSGSGKRSGFSGVTVSFGGKKARTKTSGQATIKKSFSARGTVKATATRRGLVDASTTVRVR